VTEARSIVIDNAIDGIVMGLSEALQKRRKDLVQQRGVLMLAEKDVAAQKAATVAPIQPVQGPSGQPARRGRQSQRTQSAVTRQGKLVYSINK